MRRILGTLVIAAVAVLAAIFLYHTWVAIILLGGGVALLYFIFAMIGEALRP